MNIRFFFNLLLSLAAGAMTSLPARAIGIDVGAYVSSGFADSTGAALGYGSVILVGTFAIDNATISANASNIDFLSSNFIQIGSSYIGQGNPTGSGEAAEDNHGLFAAAFTNIDSREFAGQQLYYWVFNSNNITNSSEHGIFTSTDWLIPSGDGGGVDVSKMNTDINDLNSITGTGLADTAQIVVGSFGNGINPVGGGQNFNLVAIAAVPEPATLAAILGFGTLGFAILRRRRAF